MPDLSRRSALGLLGGVAAGAFSVGLSAKDARAARVVVLGGGLGGAEAALSLRQAAPTLDVTLIERDPTALKTGKAARSNLSQPDFAALDRAGVHVAIDEAVGLDRSGRVLHALSGRTFSYDRAVIAPGVGLIDEGIEGYSPKTAKLLPHSWLRDADLADLTPRLDSLRFGATVVLRVPDGPIRFPHGPYQRATDIARHLARVNPTAKVLILDSKEEFEGREIFQKRWAADLPTGMVEWLPGHAGGRVDAVYGESNTLVTNRGLVRADLIHFIPEQKAGDFAVTAGLTDRSGWCPTVDTAGTSAVDTTLSVIGDAVLGPAKLKTAEDARLQARLCAGAVVRGMGV